ncbi:MAG: lipopolysaccharide core heptose(I) kinase RfaP [Gammaproteobacteria bacterium]|nr:lipopolysaccharide core heptose(I) kinase RfaP [Gammaproteobacteria bacterium]
MGSGEASLTRSPRWTRDLPGSRFAPDVSVRAWGPCAIFAKVHFGVGWGEIAKNLVTLRLPVLGAGDEWRAIRRLELLGVPTMTPVAFVELGRNPAAKRSAIVTQELTGTISLEDLVAEHSVTVSERRALVRRVARITHDMHDGGVNHRDLYICHFHLARHGAALEAPLYVIDLHRAQLRSRTPVRWRIKDVAGSFSSTFDAGLTRRDYLRFIRRYSGKPLERSSVRGPGILAPRGRSRMPTVSSRVR